MGQQIVTVDAYAKLNKKRGKIMSGLWTVAIKNRKIEVGRNFGERFWNPCGLLRRSQWI